MSSAAKFSISSQIILFETESSKPRATKSVMKNTPLREIEISQLRNRHIKKNRKHVFQAYFIAKISLKEE